MVSLKLCSNSECSQCLTSRGQNVQKSRKRSFLFFLLICLLFFVCLTKCWKSVQHMSSQLLRALTTGHVCRFARATHMSDSLFPPPLVVACVSHSQVEQEKKKSCSDALLHFRSASRQHMYLHLSLGTLKDMMCFRAGVISSHCPLISLPLHLNLRAPCGCVHVSVLLCTVYMNR